VSLLQCDPDLSCAQALSVLLPHLAGLVAEDVSEYGGRVVVRARPAAALAPCPDCSVLSGKRHDGYARSLHDSPCGGREVVIRLRVRMLKCVNPGCPRKTFAEQVQGLTSAWSRVTPLLRQALEAVAAVLAGRGGARLAGALGLPASRWQMIRLVIGLPEEAVVTAPRFLGIDDFALKRGRAYGTVLIDMETGAIIDVLPDRETQTVKTWLEGHPGAGVICRDRGTSYGAACAQGAPGAVQVADRWHLLHNLGDAVRKAAAAALAGRQQREGGEDDTRPAPSAHPRAAEIHHLHAAVRRLLGSGATKAAAARELGISVPTVYKYAAAATAAELIPARQPSAVDPYRAHLIRRWNEGARDAAALAAEIRKLGYKASDQQVARFLRPYRGTAGPVPAPPPPLPAARDIARWIMTSPGNLDPADAAALNAATAEVPRLAVITGLARSFADIAAALNATAGSPATGQETLETWLQAAETSGISQLASFAGGIRKDYHAVRNGLSLPFNSGMVEGTVCKIKQIKRTVYGRASFGLLRKLLLASNQRK
jgi:transposase